MLITKMVQAESLHRFWAITMPLFGRYRGSPYPKVTITRQAAFRFARSGLLRLVPTSINADADSFDVLEWNLCACATCRDSSLHGIPANADCRRARYRVYELAD